MLLILFYLLSGTRSINVFLEEAFPIAILIISFELLIYIMPLIIAVDVNRMRYENKELKNELSEIKNLLIYQNDILNSMRTPPYNQ